MIHLLDAGSTCLVPTGRYCVCVRARGSALCVVSIANMNLYLCVIRVCTQVNQKRSAAKFRRAEIEARMDQGIKYDDAGAYYLLVFSPRVP